MATDRSVTNHPAGSPVFVTACWLLGLMALIQVIIAMMALSKKYETAQQVRVVEKEVIRRVIVERAEDPATGEPAELTAKHVRPLVSLPPLPLPLVSDVVQIEPTPVKLPEPADARTARLVSHAREARVAGDMGKAVMKLEEAMKHQPGDPNVLYELGVVHEQMGVFDRAASYYEQVFQMGLTSAGVLYEMAAKKLSEGFAQPDDMLGKLSLGRVRYFHNPHHKAGEQVILTIPIQKAPSEAVKVQDIAVEVRFFNRTSSGALVELQDNSWATDRWVTLPFDWAGGEENLRMTYVIPPLDTKTEHLFGSRAYYGQIVTLTYQGVVLDVQAWPRELAAKITQSPLTGMGELVAPELQDSLPMDFDPSNPLLPALPE